MRVRAEELSRLQTMSKKIKKCLYTFVLTDEFWVSGSQVGHGAQGGKEDGGVERECRRAW